MLRQLLLSLLLVAFPALSAQNVTLNGTTYSIPNTGDQNWGTNVTNWIVAVSNHTLQKTGGAFTLTADVDLGASFGIKTAYFKSRSSNPGTTGLVRFAVGDTIAWRNNANDGNLVWGVDGSDRPTFNGNQFLTTLGTLTASRMVVTDGSANLATNSVTATEAGYVAGASSNLQTQINTKAAASDLTTHAALTAAHGATGAVVGTTNTQVLSNKTLTTPILSDPISNGLRHAVSSSLTSNTTLDGTYSTVRVSGAGSSWTLLLPAAASHTGRIYSIKRTDQTFANTVTVDGNSSETIDGATTFKLCSQNELLRIQSDGTNWIVLDHSYPKSWTSFTPALTATSVNPTIGSTGLVQSGFWRRVGDSVEVKFAIRAGSSGFAAGTGTYTFALPDSNWTIDTAKAATLGLPVYGHGIYFDDSASKVWITTVEYQSTTKVEMRYGEGAAAVSSFVTATAPASMAGSDYWSGNYTVPITNWEG